MMVRDTAVTKRSRPSFFISMGHGPQVPVGRLGNGWYQRDGRQDNKAGCPFLTPSRIPLITRYVLCMTHNTLYSILKAHCIATA